MTGATRFLSGPCIITLQKHELNKRSPRKEQFSQLILSKFQMIVSLKSEVWKQKLPRKEHCSWRSSLYCSSEFFDSPYPYFCSRFNGYGGMPTSCPCIVACVSSSTPSTSSKSYRLYVSGLSFRTTQESLRNAFEKFGQLVEVNLVMDKIAKRPRGFAFLRYETEEEAKKAIEGMHGKFLDGRVIFVEVAKPRSGIHKRQQTS
ncbi:organelle RRM domain-containing protein 6, chloroplastic isoform X1 [Amaranthus tricolor]|uniref:organelle RRM domain-containing protein 6, chloroplastic isoform X1 n=2 Tax=Amaranthus tricolor TaxID=29722 RepID=UPI002585D5F9|nr:organelle RRM domain-containing protein 6, chloroplastic isoform X1 [Amaranthus tricolor]XP_057530724.1 organelle RRM domain-containing protein 6, chloroplastic isoform X1 [Amaranthus tricolor]